MIGVMMMATIIMAHVKMMAMIVMTQVMMTMMIISHNKIDRIDECIISEA